jgi:hypothetical protein
MSISTTIKSIQDIMRKDVGVDGDAQRIGQLVWMLPETRHSGAARQGRTRNPETTLAHLPGFRVPLRGPGMTG